METAIRRLASVWPVLEGVCTKEEIDRILEAWREAGALDIPSGTTPDPLQILRRCRELNGEASALPRSLRPFPEVLLSWRRELEALRTMDREDRLPASAHGRIHNLQEYLAHSERSCFYREAKVIRLAGRRLPAIRIAALTTLLLRNFPAGRDRIGLAAISMHGKDWDNAVRLGYHTKKNRRLLRRVIRDRAFGENRYLQELPLNRAFLRSMEERSLNMQAWLAPSTWRVALGSEVVSLFAELDPLKVFQMGNLFGTCLSTEGINSHAVVANAVEVNKRVLFLRDSRGRVLGRKLIVLSRQGLLIGFRSYGTGSTNAPETYRPWVKILFDLYCRDLTIDMGSPTQSRDPHGRDEMQTESDLVLFSEWYNDGEEAFDPWIYLRMGRGPAPLPEEREAMEAWVRETSGSGCDVHAQLRALLWSGNAMSLAREFVKDGVWSKEHLSILERESVRSPSFTD